MLQKYSACPLARLCAVSAGRLSRGHADSNAAPIADSHSVRQCNAGQYAASDGDLHAGSGPISDRIADAEPDPDAHSSADFYVDTTSDLHGDRHFDSDENQHTASNGDTGAARAEFFIRDRTE